jgi:uncharacterized lipoprotein NlpE involved in copper resistance
MNVKLITALNVLTVAVLVGCNNAKSPDAVANDVAAAQKKAAESVADVRKDESKDNASATDKVDDKSKYGLSRLPWAIVNLQLSRASA